jgi:prepilin-type N-terminal cleavage/methylation domain-containing protein/prepilin-type processing-associated H-X9-DG protein
MVNAYPIHRRAFTLVEVIVCLAIVGILVGLLLSGVQKVRASADRLKCANNLKQIGLALHQYHDAAGQFPPGVVLPNDPRTPGLSWHAHLLPYIEQDAVWSLTLSAFAQTTRWLSSPPHLAIGTEISVFVCPADGRVRVPHYMSSYMITIASTSYLGVSGTDRVANDGVLYPGSQVTIAAITDGTSSTLIVAERPPSWDLDFGWWYAGEGIDILGTGDLVLGVRELAVDIGRARCPNGPFHFVPAITSDKCAFLHYWSLHSGGANMLFADGAVHFVRYESDSIMPALATRAGGEVVEIP